MQKYEVFSVALGRVLRKLRKDQKMEQWELADKTDLSQSGISRLENGGRVHMDTVYRYVNYVEQGVPYVLQTAINLANIVYKGIEDKKVPKQIIIGLTDKTIEEQWLEDAIEEEKTPPKKKKPKAATSDAFDDFDFDQIEQWEEDEEYD